MYHNRVYYETTLNYKICTYFYANLAYNSATSVNTKVILVIILAILKLFYVFIRNIFAKKIYCKCIIKDKYIF